MQDFLFYFQLGWQHIMSWEAADHLLFITALIAGYLHKKKQQLFGVISAFTLGHLITLGLSAYDVIRFSSKYVEFLIPLTIIITAGKNMLNNKVSFNYLFALTFGLIHGMGFANTIRFMLAQDQQIAIPLFSFHIGLEAGQIIVIAIILGLSYFITNYILRSPKKWEWILSAIAIAGGIYMCFERWPL